MVTVLGIGGPPDPLVPRGVGNRDHKHHSASEAPRDDIAISAEALDAAEGARLAQLAQSKSELREARVEEAKEKIREGTYKVADVVTEVAARLTRFL